jgi:hypothetical protein
MPFDGTLQHLTVADLEAYKAAQLAAHPPSFLYRHRHAVINTSGVSVVLLVLCFLMFIIAASFNLAPLVLCSLLGVCASGTVASVTMILMLACVRGDARWCEDTFLYLDEVKNVPACVRRAARSLAADCFVVGTLVQDRVVLDPYLVAHVGCEPVVVGIWDGDEVIYCRG